MSSCHCDDHKNEPSQEEKRLHESLRKIQNKLLVMSGKGGVGKSSVATYLALGLARKGYKVGLMDVDLHGPSIPRMLGITGMCPMDEEKKMLLPSPYNENLEVVSIECLLQNRDDAIIWRGPVKHGVIRQFISEVDWGTLDYLLIDSPPGTGDEPLSVAQTIPDAHAVIVTTPQEVALADVRKSINFCRKVNMPILGIVENMSAFVCPHCDKEIPLFSKGGGARTAEEMNIYLLGNLPFDPRVVEAGDAGKPIINETTSGSFIRSLDALVSEVIQRCGNTQTQAAMAADEEIKMNENGQLRLAVPLAGGLLTNHFGHCEQFALIDTKDGQIVHKQLVTPPPHEPGLLPRWLGEKGVSVIIAGGMGQRAIQLFSERGVKVVTGAPNLAPEELVKQYLGGALVTGTNVCDH